MSLININDDMLTIHSLYLQSSSDKLYPITLLAFQQAYEFLSAAKQKNRTFKIKEFKDGIKTKLDKLNMIMGSDYDFVETTILPSQKFHYVQFSDQQKVVKVISVDELLFLAKIFSFQIDYERGIINIQQNLLEHCNFQPQDKMHASFCKAIVQTKRQEGISYHILQNLLICGLIKYRYSGNPKYQDQITYYNIPFPFSAQDIFSQDKQFKLDHSEDKVIYLPPLNIWNEDDLIKGLLDQKFVQGVRWNEIKPQLNLQQNHTPNQLLDLAIAAIENSLKEERESVSVPQSYTAEQLSQISRSQQQNQYRIAQHQQPSIDSQLDKFDKLKKYLSKYSQEEPTFDIVDYNGEYVLYQRRKSSLSKKLQLVDMQKCQEQLQQFGEIPYDQAKNICGEILQKELNVVSSKGRKKQKERKSQDKWLNDHINDQWYLAARK